MAEHIDKFLEALGFDLPEVCTDRDLIEHLPNIFKSHSTLHRVRARGECPPYFLVDGHFFYLREEIVKWLRSKYKNDITPVTRVLKKRGPKPKLGQLVGAEK